MTVRDAELARLVVRRDGLQSKHEAAVALLEKQGTTRAFVNWCTCAKLYDELDAVQRKINDKQSRQSP